MIIQQTLLTVHKGVDLHAASARRVMARRLPGGDRLRDLHRAEFHTFWRGNGEAAGLSVPDLLAQGRYYNPNKHFYLHAELPEAAPWADAPAEPVLDPRWPGRVAASDLPGGREPLDRLLGGPPAADETVVDVAAFPLGEAAPLLSGVVWRLRLALRPGDDAAAVAHDLVVARSRRHGLLVNPWMQGWRLAPARTRE